ncbi:hypothetical protein FH972_025733 [Carpinus fangiana]|uniref:Uncharacterized protein n=1 Tax=Carpinus fangiana TaxID=176857 RepID=A0A5N6L2G4_9ROSI|nr:hypothetical protein FH972_025733 [Carpinus fangiana]
MGAPRKRLSYEDYNVGWICAIEPELVSARAMLDEIYSTALPKVYADSNDYLFGRIGDNNVVVASLPSGGIPDYSTANPRDIRLGDVVISDPRLDSPSVIQYDLGKIFQGEKWPRSHGRLDRPPEEIRNVVANAKSRHRLQQYPLSQILADMITRHSTLSREYEYQGAENDILFRAEYIHTGDNNNCSACDPHMTVSRPHRPSTHPVVHYGTIGSGNQVVKDSVTRDYWKEKEGILCFETEAAGLMDIFRCLVIRGICDYADSHKNKRWQSYAAAVAAAYAKDLLLHLAPPSLPGLTTHSVAHAKLLVRMDPHLGPTKNIRVMSLARSITPWQENTFKTATVLFETLPIMLQGASPPSSPISLMLGTSMSIDNTFLGFTVLSEPSVHEGFSGNAFSSWQSRNEPDYHWLRDQLPKDFPGSRTIIHGFESPTTENDSVQDIEDLSRELVFKLRYALAHNTNHRPLTLMAHSLGGIVLKRALVLLAEGSDTDLKILQRVCLIVFFGVPNKETLKESLLMLARAEGVNDAIIEQLTLDSSSCLQLLEQQYAGIAKLRHIRIVSSYETKRTLLSDEKHERTPYHRKRKEILVNRMSAIHPSSNEHDLIPINDDHFNMIRFSRDDERYSAIASCFRNTFSNSQTLLEIDDKDTAQHIKSGPNHPTDYQTDIDHFIDRGLHWTQVHPSIQSFELFIRERTEKGFQENSEHPKLYWGQYEQKIRALMMSCLATNISRSREDTISRQSPSTFEWIYLKHELGFTRWLRKGCAFWINGKPGSGKSTLMKFIWNDSRTWDCITKAQDRDTTLIKASFFFHDRGTNEQKSLEGLLQSVLSQILQEMPTLQQHLEPIFVRRGVSYGTLWRLDELEEAFSILQQQKTERIHIVLFLDALDEYKGSKDTVCTFIWNLITQPDNCPVKFSVCFSSRPWTVFLDSFAPLPSCSIHDHTTTDIIMFTEAKIKSRASLYQHLMSLNDNFERASYNFVVKIISEKAQGVFVWVVLIVDKLLKEERDGIRPQTIQHIIQHTPDELEDFYKQIADRTPQSYRLEAFIMLEVCLRYSGHLSLKIFNDAVTCATQMTHQECCQNLIEADHFSSRENNERLLKSRCGGLLELVYVSDGRCTGTYVQFMHQTVKDYVQRPGFLSSIIDQSSDKSLRPCNGYSFLFKAAVSNWNTDEPDGNKTKEIETIVDLGRSAESSTGISQRQYIDSINLRVIGDLLDCFGIRQWRDSPTNSAYWRLVFAAAAGFFLYVTDTLHEVIGSARPQTPPILNCLIDATAQIHIKQVVLDYILANGSGEHDFDVGEDSLVLAIQTLSQSYSHSSTTVKKDLEEMIRLMLFHGLSPNVNMPSRITGQNALMVATERPHVLNHCTPLHIAALCVSRAPIVAQLLAAGADVNARDTYGATPLDWLLSRFFYRRDLPWAIHAHRNTPNYRGRFYDLDDHEHEPLNKELSVSDALRRDIACLVEAGGQATEVVTKKTLRVYNETGCLPNEDIAADGAANNDR